MRFVYSCIDTRSMTGDLRILGCGLDLRSRTARSHISPFRQGWRTVVFLWRRRILQTLLHRRLQRKTTVRHPCRNGEILERAVLLRKSGPQPRIRRSPSHTPCINARINKPHSMYTLPLPLLLANYRRRYQNRVFPVISTGNSSPNSSSTVEATYAKLVPSLNPTPWRR